MNFKTLIGHGLTLLIGGLISVGHAADAGPKRPNVLFLLSDDQRPDTIHALGNDLIQTPNLDALVRSGTSMTRAVCPNPICTPSRAEIMTGCTGLRNGVFDFGRKINSDVALWAETMRQAGYNTGYVGKWHNDGSPTERGYEDTVGLYRGGAGRFAVASFDWFGRPVTGYRGWAFRSPDGKILSKKGVGLTANISSDFADAAIEYISRKREKPFFLHVKFTAPHDPLLLPPGFEKTYPAAKMPLPANFLPEHPFDHGNSNGRDERLFRWPRTPEETRGELAVYYAVISHMDAQIGRIIASLKQSRQLENTVVIFSSDHGLAVGSHGLRGKQNMYQHTIGVPMIISGPGIRKDVRSDAQCYLRDLFPTACDFAGIPIPKSVQGRSLKPVLTGTGKTLYPYTIAYFRDAQRMIRTDEWKLIHYPKIKRFQLFNLKNDPHELKDLAKEPKLANTVARLKKMLYDWQVENKDPLVQKKSG